MTLLILLFAEGEDPYDIVAPTERNGFTPLQNEWLCKWAAEEIADSLHHSNSHASFDSSAKRWIRSQHVSDEFRKLLPDTYTKILNVLKANFGCRSLLFDCCPDCNMPYRAEYRDHEECPCCALHGKVSPCWHGQGKSRRPRATLIYNPVAGYISSLWSRPDMAR